MWTKRYGLEACRNDTELDGSWCEPLVVEA